MMNTDLFYQDLIEKFRKVVEKNNLLNEKVLITGRSLTTEEAIGNPERRDFPIVKGKEKLMQAEFKAAKGQAFTDMPGSFKGSLKDVLNTPVKTNFDRAVLVATINAVLRYLGLIENTVHCKNEEPEQCAKQLVEFVREKYGSPKIALVGLQPAMLDSLSKTFTVRVVDLDPDNIGREKSGITIEGAEKTADILNWCDLILATGSTLANGSLPQFIREKPVVFYGTTAAGAAYLMGLNRYCFMAS